MRYSTWFHARFSTLLRVYCTCYLHDEKQGKIIPEFELELFSIQAITVCPGYVIRGRVG